MGVRFGAGRLRIELRSGPYSRSEAAVAWAGRLAVSGPGAPGGRGALRNSFRRSACLLRALLRLARRKRDIMSWPCGKSLFSRFEFQASGTRLRCGSLPQAWTGLSRGVRAEMSFGYGRESQGYAAGPPGNVFMNRLNFEKMDKKKLESIDDVLYTVTEGRIVRRRKNPLPALLIGVAGAGLAIWSLTASSMSEHENLASMLMLLGGGVALVGLIMAGIALASGSAGLRTDRRKDPTRQHLLRHGPEAGSVRRPRGRGCGSSLPDSARRIHERSAADPVCDR